MELRRVGVGFQVELRKFPAARVVVVALRRRHSHTPPSPAPLFLILIALWFLHVCQSLAILSFLRVHAHPCHHQSGDATRNTEAPVDAGIHCRVWTRLMIEQRAPKRAVDSLACLKRLIEMMRVGRVEMKRWRTGGQRTEDGRAESVAVCHAGERLRH